MTRYNALALTTSYWRPGDNYTDKIISALEGKIENGDFVVVSEKAIAVARGNIVDEATVEPSLTAQVSRGFLDAQGLGLPAWHTLRGFGQRLLRRLRDYPLESGSRHKQVALEHAGFLQALMFGSEGGIDGSNLAYSYREFAAEKRG